jgi:hypothetical protein
MNFFTAAENIREKAAKTLHDIRSAYLRDQNSSFAYFLLKFYDTDDIIMCDILHAFHQLLEKHDPALKNLNTLLNDIPLVVDTDNLMFNFLTNIFRFPKTYSGEQCIEVIKGLDVENQMMTMYKFKDYIESSFEKLNTLREWEAMRYKNIQDYNIVTLLGSCKSCQKIYPFQMDTWEFFSEGKAPEFGIMQTIVHIGKECPFCGAKGIIVTITHKHLMMLPRLMKHK